MTRRRRQWVAAGIVALAAAASLLAAVTHSGTPSSRSAVQEEEAGQKAAGEEEGEKYDHPQEALDFFVLKRSPDGKSPLDYGRYRTAIERSKEMARYSTASGQALPPSVNADPEALPAGALKTWSPLGPGNIGGRTRALVVDPTDANIMYAAGVAGGIWKTTNGGSNWAPIGDFLANIAVTVLVMDPADPGTLYAGTGELFTSGGVRGAGIFKSTDAGQTWNQAGSTGSSADFRYVNDIVVSANDGLRAYAATQTGVFRTLDGGANWTGPLAGITAGNGCSDLAIRTDTAQDTVFASCGISAQATVYRNTDAGGTGIWSAVLAEAGMWRTSLAIAKSNQNVIYALAEDGAAGNYFRGLRAVYRSTTGGGSGSWTARVRNTSPTKLSTLLLSNPREATAADCLGGQNVNAWFNQGYYDNVIAVDPVDPDVVWAGGIDLFRSNDGGQSWGHASRWLGTPFVHADQHAIVFHPSYNGTTNKTMWVGNDGGIFKTTDARAAVSANACSPHQATGISVPWANLNNGYAVTQFYDGALYPNGATYFGGTQDNGTVRGNDAAGPNAWTEIRGGDGGYVAVDKDTTSTLYSEYVYFEFSKSVDSGTNWTGKGAATVGVLPHTCANGGECFLFIAPFTMHSQISSRLWAGGWYVWRTTDSAVSWSRVGLATPGSVANKVSAIDNAPTDGNRLLVGMSAEGQILRLSNALTADSTTAWGVATPRAGYVSSVAFDPSNASVAYATYSTFGGTHVWKSTDSGATWSPIDGVGQGTLPDIPVHSIVVDPATPSRLYIGTDLGVYVSLDGGANWSVENTGFANVPTEKLRVNTTASGRTLFAFTHGRGAFKVALTGAPANDAFVDAQVLAGVSGAAPGSNVNASKQTLEPAHGNNTGGSSIWYSWTAPGNGTLTLDTRGSANGADTTLAVYTGSTVGNLVLPAPEWQNDDEAAGIQTSKVGPLNVTAGTTYHIAVDGYKEPGQPPWAGVTNLNWSSTSSVTAPSAPTLTSATAGTNSVTLNWTAPSDGGSPITSYRIYRGTTSGGQVQLTPTVPALVTATSYTDATAANGTTYYYKVTAVNAIGESLRSNEQSATPGAVVSGANVNVSKAAGNQAEGTIAVNPANTSQVFAASNGAGAPFWRSTDGGATWVAAGAGIGASCCDEAAAFDAFGNLFLVNINSALNAIVLYLSTDGGATFSLLQTIDTGSGDQPSLDAGAGSVWVTWNDGAIKARGAAVTGLGAANIAAFSAEQQAPGTNGQFGDVAIGPTGKVVVTYQSDTQIFANTDADGLGGGGFGAQVVVSSTNVDTFDFIPAQNDRSIDAEANLAYDRSGAHNGRLYLSYTDEPINESNDTNIYLRHSDDNGATWSAPLRVNDDATTTSQFLPNIALDQTTGVVAVTWHDARADPVNNNLTRFWGAASSDGGASFGPNFQISTGQSNNDTALSGVDYGDYTMADAYGGKLYAFWADNSNSTGDNPAGANSTFDMYTASVTISGSGPNAPGAPTAVSATAGNAQATVSWSAPASDGGSPVTGYVVTPFVGAVAQATKTVGNVTSATVTGLVNGTTYTFKVAATNAIGTGPQSLASSAVTPSPSPANDAFVDAQVLAGVSGSVAGSNVGATKETGELDHAVDAGGKSVWYRWTAPADGQLTVDTAGSIDTGTAQLDTLLAVYTGSAVNALTLPGSGWQNDDENNPAIITSKVGPLTVTAGTVYRIAVDGFKGTAAQAADGSISLQWSFTGVGSGPGAPTNVTAVAGNAQATVSWSAPASDGGSPVTGYVVTPFVGAVAQATKTVGNVTSTTVTGLVNGTTYTFKVAATNAIGTGPQSPASNAVTPATTPGAPVLVSATAGNNSVALVWSAPASNGGSAITGYRIYRSTQPGLETLLAAPPGTGTSYTDATAVNGTTYYYKVTAVNAVGESTRSNELSATPTGSPTAPAAPSNLTALALSRSQIGLAWTDNASNETGFRIERSWNGVGDWRQIGTVAAGVTSYTHARQPVLTTFFYRVRATNAVGDSAYSNVASATTLG